jgi:hypothetical protein
MPSLNSRVWRRYGQLRIYVSAGDQPVGWFDPGTGRSEISQASRRDEFWVTVRAECQRLSLDGRVTEPALSPAGQRDHAAAAARGPGRRSASSRAVGLRAAAFRAVPDGG